MKTKFQILVLLITMLLGLSLKAKQLSSSFFIAPNAEISNVWSNHNQYQNGKKGMVIHMSFKISGMKKNRCNAIAYFTDQHGNSLTDRNGKFRTKTGGVAAGRYFTPGYDKTVYNDFSFFMPYEELHVIGKHRLKFFVEIRYNNSRKVGETSKKVAFNLDWRSNRRPKSKPLSVSPGSVTISIGKSEFSRAIYLYNQDGYRKQISVKRNSTKGTFSSIPPGNYTVQKFYGCKCDMADDGIKQQITVYPGQITNIRL